MHHRHQQPRHQRPRQHGDTLLEPPRPVYYPPPPVYYSPAPAPEPQYRRPSLVGAFVGGMVGFVLGIFKVLGHMAMLVVAVLLLLAVLGVGALVGIHKLTVWANDHPSTTTTVP